ncbi:50S ribosomal protein L11 methyltransferase [uncultured Shimia sp.]|uniref:50S ribosomal protein L11 methyltransferase n=1 Tax=uncultured Shimia sp. TaxID=573152 RepID=UPI0025EDB9A2|nr:50S ribosomal protein L11 methyltransferase [uncultured Shimia sp.]
MLDANSLVALAENAPLGDGGVHASNLLAQALEKDPHHHAAHLLKEQLHQMFVPRWHFPMLADTVRNQAYAKAIAAKVQPGDIVLDIGCGAGLTAMLAARAGAKHVYAIEGQPLIAAAAKQVIADNNLSDKITVLSKWSHELIIGEDLPNRADVVVSEIVDSNLLGEGALATLTHAMEHLAKPNARAVPESGTLKAQLVESAGLRNQYRPLEAEGFDLSAFHKFANVAQVTPNDSAACGLRPLGPTNDLFHFDFTCPDMSHGKTTVPLFCTAVGTAHAVVVSFDMVLAPGISVSNDLNTDGHWGRFSYLLEQATPVSIGSQVTITAQHDATKLSVSIHDTAQVERPIIWQRGVTTRTPTAHETTQPNATWYVPDAQDGPVSDRPVH